jgi:hypothetical protein
MYFLEKPYFTNMPFKDNFLSLDTFTIDLICSHSKNSPGSFFLLGDMSECPKIFTGFKE